MIAMVIIRFVAILENGQSFSSPDRLFHTIRMREGKKYLRAIPRKVLTLRSTYPSLSSIVILVCWMVSLCSCKSAKVSLPIPSVSWAVICAFLNRCELRSSLSVPESSCCRCSSWSSVVGLSEYRFPNRALRSSERVFSLRLAASISVSKFRKRWFIFERAAEGMLDLSIRIWSSLPAIKISTRRELFKQMRHSIPA